MQVRSKTSVSPAVASVVLCVLTLAASARADSLNQANQPLVYGTDDRQEFFEVADPRARAVISESMVALVPKARLGGLGEPFPTNTPTRGDFDRLCPEEPFRDQPAAAYCTGVLVDWNLILTAGHCLRALAVEDVAVVFDYYYEGPGKIATRKEDAREVVEIMAEALDPQGVVPRLDYGWLRLGDDADPSRRPVPVHIEPPPLSLGDSIISMGAGGGVPIKFDAGGRVRNLRQDAADFFVADVDTSRGSSGASAFNQNLALLGILARGGLDFVDRADGCRATNRVSEDDAMEQFTYAYRAVAGLCAKNPQASSLCRAQCGEPCEALPRPIVGGGGCSLVGHVPPASGFHATLLLGLALILGTRRLAGRRRVASRSIDAPVPPFG